MSPVREEPQHTNTCDQPCQPDRTCQSGRSHNTRTHATKPAGQTTLGRSPVRKEPQHTNTCNQTCQPDRTWQVAGQGGAATHEHMRPNLPARPHLAGHRSGRSLNTRTHATKPASQTALGRSPVREEPQHTNTCDQPCRPDRTWQVAGQGGASTHKHMRPTLPARPHLAGHRSGRSRNTRTHMRPTLAARPHLAGRQSGRSRNTQTHATNPAGQTALGRSPVREEPQHTNTHATNPGGQTALGRSPVREEPQHTNTCDQPCQPDRTWQVTGQGGSATHEHMRPTMPARSHSAGRRSGRSHNTYTCDQPC